MNVWALEELIGHYVGTIFFGESLEVAYDDIYNINSSISGGYIDGKDRYLNELGLVDRITDPN